MEHDLYSFVFRGQLAEQALDKAGRSRYATEEAFFSEELAQKLHFNEIDSKYVEQSKTMITVFATITAFENATREFVYSVLLENYKTEWWTKGVQNNIKTRAESRKAEEAKGSRCALLLGAVFRAGQADAVGNHGRGEKGACEEAGKRA